MTNLRGEPAHVGRFCGSNTYEVTPEVVAFYCDALDDPHPAYQQWAPPLLHHSECYKFVGDWYLKNLFGNLHAQQDWELFAPIPVGGRIRSVSTIIDRSQKRERLYVVNETDLFDVETGRLLVRGRTFQSFLPSKKNPTEGEFVVDSAKAAAKPPQAMTSVPSHMPKSAPADSARTVSGTNRVVSTVSERAKSTGAQPPSPSNQRSTACRW